MHRMFKLEQLWIVLLLVTLAACAAMNQTTFNEKLAVGYGTVTQVRTTATQLLQAKKISADDAQNVLTTTDTARAGLDIARGISTTDVTGATNKLNAVTSALSAIQTYLSTKGN